MKKFLVSFLLSLTCIFLQAQRTPVKIYSRQDTFYLAGLPGFGNFTQVYFGLPGSDTTAGWSYYNSGDGLLGMRKTPDSIWVSSGNLFVRTGTNEVQYSLSVSGGTIPYGNLTGSLNSQTDLRDSLRARAYLSHTHAYSSLTGLPTLFSGSYTDLTSKPTLFSGAYTDLTGKPTLFSGAYVDLTGKPTYATVATTGAYSDLTGKPTLATVATSGAYSDLTGKPAAYDSVADHANILTSLGFLNTNKLDKAATIKLDPSYVIGNANDTLNSYIRFNDAGLLLTRRKSGSNPAAIINQSFSTATGDILDLQFNSVNKVTFGKTGTMIASGAITATAITLTGMISGGYSYVTATSDGLLTGVLTIPQTDITNLADTVLAHRNQIDINTAAITTNTAAIATKQATITATTSADYYRGDKTFQPLTKAAVGLSAVINTDTSRPDIATAINARTTKTYVDAQDALNTKYTDTAAMLAAYMTMINSKSDSVKITVFYTSGTYTIPANSKAIQIRCIAGGAGGGSGRKDAAGTARAGGNGGSAGALTERLFKAGDLTGPLQVTVGTGGTGGAAQATSTANGNSGGAGGVSQVANASATVFIKASGGNAAFGGFSTVQSAAGAAGGQWISSAGGQSSITATPGIPTVTANTSGAGAGGGGISTANVAFAGGIGGTRPFSADQAGSGTSGAVDAAGGAGGNGITNYDPAGGGGGGGGSTTTNGGAGGAGGFPGGGGAGGGAATNAVGNSGAGGNGANGIVIIWSWQ